MAASRENILSLGHLTGTERNTFTKQREQSLKKSVNRPILLQADLLTPQSHHQLEVMHLQQRWQELKERELTAQKHNRLLLQQFDEAQDTLSEMITLTAAMKTIRKEYERYLEESSPRWQQQLEEKTQAAWRKRMDEYLRSRLKNTEDQVTKSSVDRPSFSHGPSTMPKEVAVPPKHYSQNSPNQDGSPHLPYMQSSRQTFPQSQTARLHIGAPYQPQGSSHVPPSFLSPRIFPHPHSFQLDHLASTLGHHHPGPRQNPPGWASLQPNYHWSWAAGAAGIPSGSEPLWGQLYMEEPPSETAVAQAGGEEADTSRAPSSKRERSGGDRSSHASQELDIKPVRLSDGHAESSESSPVREKRKKKQNRGRSQCSSSDRERCSSQKLKKRREYKHSIPQPQPQFLVLKRSSTTSSGIVIAAVTVAQSSESDDSSVKGRTSTSRGMRRSGGLAAESPRAEKVAKGSKGVDSGSHKEESQCTSEELQNQLEESRSENVGNQSPDDKSENYREESESRREKQSGSVSIKIEKGGGAEMEEQSSSSEHSSGREKDEEDLGDDSDAEEKEKNQTDVEKAKRDVEDDDDASERKNKSEEEEETEDQDEESQEEGNRKEKLSDRLTNEDGENTQQGSASSQDEEVDEDQSEEGEDNTEEGESDEEEQRRDKTGEAEKERDSEDSIISPQDKSKKIHTIAEEASDDDDDDEVEEEGGSKMGSSDDGSNDSSDDVEHLLAPQQSQKKKEKDLRADVTPKAICEVEIFQVDKSTKLDHRSDSDEFDDFYG